MRWLAVLLVVLVSMSACFPAIAHPTRVEPGLGFGSFLTAGLAKDSVVHTADVNNQVLPSIDFELSLETRDTLRPNTVGLRLAANAGLSGAGASVYAELPRSWMRDVDVGLGYLMNRGYIRSHGPYVQFGKLSSSGSSWFMRNGIVWTSANDAGTSSVVWIPALGTSRRLESGNVAALFLAGIVGVQTPVTYPCSNFDCSASPNGFRRTYVTLGVSHTYRLDR